MGGGGQGSGLWPHSPAIALGLPLALTSAPTPDAAAPALRVGLELPADILDVRGVIESTDPSYLAQPQAA